MEYFQIDEGHLFSMEEMIAYTAWKVKDLIKEGWNTDDILSFCEHKTWKEITQNILLESQIAENFQPKKNKEF